MNTKSLWIPLVTLGLAGGYGVSQDQENQELEAKLAAVETRLTAIETYLQAQSKGAEAYGLAVAKAVEEGYTWGENNDARKLLVGAWKAQVAVARAKVPGKIPAKAEPKVDPRIARRRPIK